MKPRIDMTGKVFGRWTVHSYAGSGKWLCHCECGVQRNVDGHSLRSGRSQGCISCHSGAGVRTTHGESKTRLYNIWIKMHQRCGKLTDPAYPKYGGRGVSVCTEWAEYEAFSRWACSAGYADNLTIDRINNDGNYEPANCRWTTYAEQNRNYSRNRPIYYNGEYVLIPDLATRFGIDQGVLHGRIRRYGWSIEKALTTPVRRRRRNT